MAVGAEEKLRRQPRTLTYVIVAGILTLMTGMEVLVYNVEPLKPVLVPVLLVLMVAKFALVVMFYMHLRFDERVFTGVFVLLLFFAAALVFSLISLFLYLGMVHHA